MSNKYPVDPFLAEISLNQPNIAAEIFEAVLAAIRDKNTFYKNMDNPLFIFENIPEEVLLELNGLLDRNMYEDYILRHPNCPQSLIDEALKNIGNGKFSYVVHNPKLSKEQLELIVKNGQDMTADWARMYLMVSNQSNLADDFVLNEIKKNVDTRSFITHHLMQNAPLTDKTVEKLLKKYANEKSSKYLDAPVGQALAANEQLSNDSKKAIAKAGFILKPDKNFNDYKYFLTSYLFPLAVSFTMPKGSMKELEAIYLAGHPFGILYPNSPEVDVVSSEENLFQLFKSEYLHRMFWAELNGIDGFSLSYHNGYRVEDLFIEHSVLGREFSDCDYEQGWLIGGVLPGYENRTWIKLDRYLIFEQAVRVITGMGGSTIEDFYVESESFADAYPVFLGFMHDFDCEIDFSETYGVTPTEKSESVIDAAATEIADREDEDVDVFFEDNFKETFSWKKLPDSKKGQLLNLLIWGFNSESPYLAKTSEHFLGCAALHPATPKDLLLVLSDSKSALVEETLKCRAKK